MRAYFYFFIAISVLFFMPISAWSYSGIPMDSSQFDQYVANQDVIIINEENTIDIQGQKAAYIFYTISKTIKFKIQKKTGIEKMSDLVLPESFDPVYLAHFPDDRNYTLAYSEMKCIDFNVHITDSMGLEKMAEWDVIKEDVEMLMLTDSRYGKFRRCTYQIHNLQIGDEITVEYKYTVNYDVNFLQLSSFRIFFNGKIFKKNYQLKISHSKDLLDQFEYANAAEPDSVYEEKKMKVYYWRKKDLLASINEAGARPHLCLPYFVFSIFPYELLYELSGSFEERIMPLYSLYAGEREQNHLGIAKSVFQGVKNNQYIQVNKFIQRNTENITDDTLHYKQLKAIHHNIVDDFIFDNDIEYFKNNDTREARIGDYLSKKTLRDINRYDTYVALILKLKLSYFTTYLCDNRVGEISKAFCKPMGDSDYLFSVVLKNNSVQFLYPKKTKTGYYLNEIPFYFENTRARLVILDDYHVYESPLTEVVNNPSMYKGTLVNNTNQRILMNKPLAKDLSDLVGGTERFEYSSEYRVYNSNIAESFRDIQLPKSKIEDNYRRSNIMVQVSLKDTTVSFHAKVQLSGQFSTLTRGLYQHNDKDESINSLYNKKIWELNNDVKLIRKSVQIRDKEFPFTAVVEADYKANNLLRNTKDTIFLCTENWFNHIIYTDLDTTYRQLDFYPDFYAQDSYVYYIKLDQNIKLIQTDYDIEIKNEFGELSIKTEQIQADVVKISSLYSITTNMVKADQIGAVKNIYTAIQKMNNGNIKFILE